MSEEWFYNPFNFVNRMMTDIEEILNPIVFNMHPLLRILSTINVGLVVFVFAVLLFYMFCIRHHHIMRKLRRSTNYFAAGTLLIIYAVLSEIPMKIGPELSLNIGLVVMPLAAKLFGPIIASAFGIIQYATSFIMHPGEAFDFSAMLVAGISGILYGWIIYARKTRYMRCLWAKLLVNIVCNIMLVPMVRGQVVTLETVEPITRSIVTNIFLAPVQALLIFVALLIMKRVRKDIRRVSWGLGK